MRVDDLEVGRLYVLRYPNDEPVPLVYLGREPGPPELFAFYSFVEAPAGITHHFVRYWTAFGVRDHIFEA